jgi:MFS family permease
MHSPVVGGVLIFVLTVSAAVSVLLLRAWAPQRMLISGIVALIAGVGTTLLAIDSGNAVLFFLGTIVAGFGFGVGFLGALRTLLPLAQPHERAGLMAAYYILSYLAFCLPAILAGIMVSHFGLIAASNYYGLALMALGGAALVGVKLFPVDC